VVTSSVLELGVEDDVLQWMLPAVVKLPVIRGVAQRIGTANDRRSEE
jgi:hypothetical protein